MVTRTKFGEGDKGVAHNKTDLSEGGYPYSHYPSLRFYPPWGIVKMGLEGAGDFVKERRFRGLWELPAYVNGLLGFLGGLLPNPPGLVREKKGYLCTLCQPKVGNTVVPVKSRWLRKQGGLEKFDCNLNPKI